jgi:hypothetical protein
MKSWMIIMTGLFVTGFAAVFFITGFDELFLDHGFWAYGFMYFLILALGGLSLLGLGAAWLFDEKKARALYLDTSK